MAKKNKIYVKYIKNFSAYNVFDRTLSLKVIPVVEAEEIPGITVLAIVPATASVEGMSLKNLGAEFIGVNGTVYSIASDGSGGWIVGGYFNKVFNADQLLGNAAKISLSDHTSILPFLYTDGTINCSIPDGSGGLIIGGDFLKCLGQSRSRLAWLSADGSLKDWAPDFGQYGAILSMCIAGDKLIVGGDFTFVNNIKRNYIVSFSLSTGQMTDWNPNPDSSIRSLIASGTDVIATGYFQTIAGSKALGIAKISTLTSTSNNNFAAVPNVSAVVEDGVGGFVVSGDFTKVAPNNGIMGRCLKVSSSNDQAISTLGDITDGTVRAVCSDGSGGLIIAGNFSKVFGQRRGNIARINADGTLNSWNPEASSTVYCVLLNGAEVVVGGTFSTIGTAFRYGLASLSLSTGLATSWDPGTNGSVYSAVLVGGTDVIVGGYFSTLGGLTRSNIGRVPLNSNVATSWNPGANSTVSTLALSGSTLVVGGSFTSFGSYVRRAIASISTSSSTASSWNPGPSSYSYVNSIVIDGTDAVIAGYFSTFGGLSRSNICRVPLSSNTATSWNPGANSSVAKIDILGTTIYAGGSFSSFGGQLRTGVAAISTSSNTPTSWNPNLDQPPVEFVAISGTDVILSGYFNFAFAINREGICRIGSDGTVSSWNPGASGQVYCLERSGDTIFAGGSFFTLGGQSRSCIGAVSLTTGVVTAWNPGADNAVRLIKKNGTNLIVFGDFTTLGGQAVSYLGMLSTESNTALSWRPTIQSTQTWDFQFVRHIQLYNGNAIILGSGFAKSSQTRYGLCKINSDGSISNWNPATDMYGSVQKINVYNNNVYMSGYFSSLGGESRSYLGAVSLDTGVATPWNPSPNSSVEFVKIKSGNAYVGGWFSSIGGASRNYLAKVDLVTATATSWNPSPDSITYDVAFSGSNVFVIGNFQTIGGQTRNYIASIPQDSNTATDWYPLFESSANRIAINESRNELVATGLFSSVQNLPAKGIVRLNTTSSAYTFQSYPLTDNQAEIIADGDGWIFAGSFSNYYEKNKVVGNLVKINLLDQTDGISVGQVAGNSVKTVISDGAGGWIIGGYFKSCAGQARNGLARINADGTLNSWNPSSSGGYTEINSLVKVGDTVYVGGSFTTMGGMSRSNLAAVSLTTGTATSWDPNVNSSIYKMIVNGSEIIIAGDFWMVGNTSRRRLAAIPLASSTPTSWNPAASGAVYDIVLNGSDLLVAGNFTSLGGAFRSNVGAVSITTGLATAWNPNADNWCKSLLIHDSHVFIGGFFSSVGGAARLGLAQVPLNSNTPTSWNPGMYLEVNCFAIHNNNLIVGGAITVLGGKRKSGIGIIPLNSDVATDWNPNINSNVQSITVIGDYVLIGHTGLAYGGIPRNGAIKVKADGSVDPWNPNYTYSNIQAAARNGNQIVWGGFFRQNDDKIAQNIAKISL